jgi:hypothetical protein
MAKVKNGRVRPDAPPLRTLTFSFKHLDLTHRKFKSEDCTLQFWNSLLSALKYFSERTVEDFRDIDHSEHRHFIDFRETSEPSGFGIGATDDVDLWQQPWQFALEPDPCAAEVAVASAWRNNQRHVLPDLAGSRP